MPEYKSLEDFLLHHDYSLNELLKEIGSPQSNGYISEVSKDKLFATASLDNEITNTIIGSNLGGLMNLSFNWARASRRFKFYYDLSDKWADFIQTDKVKSILIKTSGGTINTTRLLEIPTLDTIYIQDGNLEHL